MFTWRLLPITLDNFTIACGIPHYWIHHTSGAKEGSSKRFYPFLLTLTILFRKSSPNSNLFLLYIQNSIILYKKGVTFEIQQVWGKGLYTLYGAPLVPAYPLIGIFDHIASWHRNCIPKIKPLTAET